MLGLLFAMLKSGGESSSQSISIFGNLVPNNSTQAINTPVTLGVKFWSSQTGTISAIRFYRASGNGLGRNDDSRLERRQPVYRNIILCTALFQRSRRDSRNNLIIDPSEPRISADVNTVQNVNTKADHSAVTLGLKFCSTQPSTISDIRFYRGAKNSSGYVARLYSAGGTLLAQATLTTDSCAVPCWQQANFASPVSIAANTTYVASYYTSNALIRLRSRSSAWKEGR
jgi:hypothetical protein